MNLTPRFRSICLPAAALALVLAAPAFGQLERVGPVSSANGYPLWYQDKTGLTLEFCSPTTAAELQGGWCVLLPGDTVAPENIDVAGQFADEHFYFLASAAGTTTSGGKAKLVLALEGAFGGGPVLKGDQIVFARVRAAVTGLPAGDYKVYHPYGVIGPVSVDAGGRLFATEDIGLGCPPGQFDCALAGKIGPYLLPSAAPGGAELPATSNPSTGRLYLADPARLGPVTGSPVGQNYFRVVSVAGGVETDILRVGTGAGSVTDFSLAGRIFTGVIPGRVTVDRAIYTSNGSGRQVDVFASIFPTVQARVPASGKPAEATPVVGYYHGPCNADPTTGALSAPTGQISAAMRAAGHIAWGQSTPASATDPIPAQVCVEDRTSNTFYQANVTDDVRVTQALFDPQSNQLTVNATTSDADPTVQLTLVYPDGKKTLNSGSTSVVIAAPPTRIQVTSSRSGSGQGRVTPLLSGTRTPLTDILVAQNLIAQATAGGTVTIPVPNSGLSSNTIVLLSAPAQGSATVTMDANGATNAIQYTALATAGGRTDAFTYQLVSNCTAPCTAIPSNVATVTVNIAAPAPPPPQTGEAIVVGAANYRGDQQRWTVSGTDTLQAGQLLTIRNIGSTTVPKNVTIGQAVVPAGGAWTMDVRGVGTALAPVAGDRVVAVNATVTPNVTSAPVVVAIR